MPILLYLVIQPQTMFTKYVKLFGVRVQAEAEDQGIGVWNYVWYFTFAREDGETAHIVAERYDNAMIELAELIRIDGTDDSVMPF